MRNGQSETPVFRQLRAGDDLLLLRWLTDPAVLEFYEGRDRRFDLAAIREKFFSGNDIRRRIIEYAGRPAGYLQDYSASPGGRAAAFDLFIGEPVLWGRGLGRRIVGKLVRELFRNPAVETVQADPRVENRRAIRCYAACGFEPVRLLPANELHEGKWRDALLMVRRRDPERRA